MIQIVKETTDGLEYTSVVDTIIIWPIVSTHFRVMFMFASIAQGRF